MNKRRAILYFNMRDRNTYSIKGKLYDEINLAEIEEELDVLAQEILKKFYIILPQYPSSSLHLIFCRDIVSITCSFIDELQD